MNETAAAPPAGTVAPETVERLRLVIARLARLLRQQDESGLGPTITAALSTINKHGPLTLGDLAASERVAPPTITKIVDKMEKAGLVQRTAHAVDRRVSLVGITELGAARLDEFRSRRTAWLSARLDELDADDVALLAGATDVLERIVDQPDPGGVVTRTRTAVRDTFSSFRFRNFRLFFAGQGISQIGNWLTLVAQSLLVLHLTDNNGLAVGLLTACQFAPVLLFGAWAGLVADRSDKRRLLMIVQAIAMVQSFALAALAFSGNPPIWSMYLVAFVGGMTTAFDNPTRRAFVVEMVPVDDVQNAVSLNSALMTSARIFGPALAGLLIVTVGYGWCFAVDGLSYIAVIIGLAMIRKDELRPAPVTAKAKGQVRAGLRYARSKPDLWVPLVMMAIIGTFTFNFNVIMPLFVKTTLGGSDTTFTILYSVVSIGSFVGALFTARRKTIEVHDVVVGAGIFGVAMLAFSASPGLVASFPFAIFVGFSSILFMTASTAIVQVRAEPEMRGRVLALQAIVFLGSTPIGGPLIGWVCDAFGARAGIVVGGLAALGAAAWGYVADGRRVRDVAPTEPMTKAAVDAPITRETPLVH